MLHSLVGKYGAVKSLISREDFRTRVPRAKGWC